MLTVACVLRSGGCYDAEYVSRLADGVKRHGGHDLVCLSDVDVPCQRIPLTHNWPGWWAKIELFKLSPPVLFFDLDTVICGDLSGVMQAAQQHPFIVLRDFYREKGFQSAMMAWASDQRALYEKFANDPQGWITRLGGRGDQGFIEEIFPRNAVKLWQGVLPGQVVSYKVHVRKAIQRGNVGTGEIPPDARVVCFHGKPKPRDIGWTL